MSRIVTKRYLGKRKVFNMEVEGLHNFVTAGGIVLHNCDMLRYYCVSRTMRAEAQEAEEAIEDDDENEEDYDTFMTGGEVSADYMAY
jgi:hypothetical protein